MSTISASTTSTTAFKITTDTTGALVFQTGASPTTAVTIDGSQNVGIGVTPSAWGNTYSALQVGTTGGIFALKSGLGSTYYMQNSYFNGSSFIYTATGAACYFQTGSDASFTWRQAASGTAGNAITFTQAMTLDANAKLSTNAAQSGDSGASSATRTLLQQQTSGTQATASVFTVYGIIHPSVYRTILDSSTGSGSAAPLTFSVGNSEIGRFDTSGSLLVGTTTLGFSAKSQFVLDGGSATNSTPNNAGVLVSRTTGASGESLALRVKSGAGISGTTYPAQVVSAGNNVFEFYTTGAAPIVFGTNNTDRARITAAGDFDLYITGPKDGQLRWTTGGGGSVQAYIYANGNPELIAQCGGSGGVKLTSGATSWVSASDIRSKDIIEHITDAVTKVATLSSIIYSFKDDEQQTRRVGLVAQELLEVLPEAVYVPTKEGEFLGVRYAEVVPLLVAAIKELNTRLTALEAK